MRDAGTRHKQRAGCSLYYCYTAKVHIALQNLFKVSEMLFSAFYSHSTALYALLLQVISKFFVIPKIMPCAVQAAYHT